jgi:PTH1 family peptidyl-tRNA hydrolase
VTDPGPQRDAGPGHDPTAGVWLVVGLGNPGPEYAANRHNVGALVLDVLAGRVGGSFKRHKARAAVLEGRLGLLPGGAPGPRVVLAKPSSYMNESGGPVAGLLQFYGIEPARVVVVHDEIDIPFADVRLKRGGGEGGHNGLRSISRSLGTKDYLRVRVGVGRPPGRMDAADYVLRDFSGTERKDLGVLLEVSADAVELLILEGLTAAQQKVHAPA